MFAELWCQASTVRFRPSVRNGRLKVEVRLVSRRYVLRQHSIGFQRTPILLQPRFPFHKCGVTIFSSKSEGSRLKCCRGGYLAVVVSTGARRNEVEAANREALPPFEAEYGSSTTGHGSGTVLFCLLPASPLSLPFSLGAAQCDRAPLASMTVSTASASPSPSTSRPGSASSAIMESREVLRLQQQQLLSNALETLRASFPPPPSSSSPSEKDSMTEAATGTAGKGDDGTAAAAAACAQASSDRLEGQGQNQLYQQHPLLCLSVPSLSLHHETHLGPENRDDKRHVEGYAASLLSRPLEIKLAGSNPRALLGPETSDDNAPLKKEGIDMNHEGSSAAASLLLMENLAESFGVLLDARLRAYATFLARHGIALAKSSLHHSTEDQPVPSPCAVPGVLTMEEKVRSLLEMGASVRARRMTIDFVKRENEADEDDDDEEAGDRGAGAPVSMRATMQLEMTGPQGGGGDKVRSLRTVHIAAHGHAQGTLRSNQSMLSSISTLYKYRLYVHSFGLTRWNTLPFFQCATRTTTIQRGR
jgi:hypothetical protein